jgi:hypothetical protein
LPASRAAGASLEQPQAVSVFSSAEVLQLVSHCFDMMVPLLNRGL